MKYSDCHILHNIITSAANDKGVTLSRQMVKQLYAEIRAMGTFEHTFEQFEHTTEQEKVPQGEFHSLGSLVQNLTDKPLSTWQRNTLDRWDKQIESNPPTYNPVLNVGVSEQDRERGHQINRIKDVVGATTNAASCMYDQGVRIIEQE